MKKTILVFIMLITLNNLSFAMQSCVTDRQDSVIPDCQYLGDFSDENAVNSLKGIDADDSTSNEESQEPNDTPANNNSAPQQECQWWQLFCRLGWW